MKNSLHLIRLATKFGNKYANIDASTIKNDVIKSIYLAIANASNQKSSGIMPFLQMLDQDQADMNINITRNEDKIAVSQPSFSDASIASKYTALSAQIQSYLEQNLEVFPTQRNNDLVDYNRLTVTLNYSSNVQGGYTQQ
jgi:phage terminase large subunit-like protein